MISVNLSASCGATRCHITWVEENPCSNNSGGPLPPTRAKIRPDLVLIHSDAYPGNKSARSGISETPWQRHVTMSWSSDGGRCFKHCSRLPLASLGVMPFIGHNQQQPSEETSHVDRFRSPGRGQGDPRKSPPM